MNSLSLPYRREINIRLVTQGLPSTVPSSYVIERRNYSRSNSDERLYKTKWWATLMRTYDCRCGLCGEDRDGIELDHFWVPKSHGGCFIMRSVATLKLVNNAVPLCTACNRQKQDHIMAVDSQQTLRLAEANRRMSAAVNDDVVEPAAKLSGYIPGDERRMMGVPGLLREIGLVYKSNPSERILDLVKEEVDRYLLVKP